MLGAFQLLPQMLAMLHLRLQFRDLVLRFLQLRAQRVALPLADVAFALRLAQARVEGVAFGLQARRLVARLVQLLLRLLVGVEDPLHFGAGLNHLFVEGLLFHLQARAPVALQAVVDAQGPQLAVAAADQKQRHEQDQHGAHRAGDQHQHHVGGVLHKLLRPVHRSSVQSKSCGTCCPVPISFNSSKLPSGS